MNRTAPREHLEAARRTLEAAGQGHVLRFIDALDDHAQRSLLDQVESVDWSEVTRLIQSHVKCKPVFQMPRRLEPAPCYPNQPPHSLRRKYEEARRLGEQLVRQGKVAAFTVAGGQGTRLGWDAPKGTFPATPIRKLPLFACLAEFILKTQRKYGCVVPWYVMTSPANDAQTRRFFREQNHFGLRPDNIMIFPQAMMPAIDAATGKVLLECKGSLALSPNGHGGSLKALFTSGALADMLGRGVEQISYTQVDNPLVRVVDPLFIGLHALDGAQMSSKAVVKASATERVGNFCLADGRVTVIEYSDLPDELAKQTNPDGTLRFSAGSIAIHVIRVDFVQSLNESAGGFALPFHRADKKVPCLNPDTGGKINPDKPNAVKLETFVFDALPLCEKSIVYQTDRVEEFAPIKNADGPGAVDCPATSKALQTQRAARWLESRGVKVPRRPDGSPDAVIEIKQTIAIEPADLEGVELPRIIRPGDEVLI